MSLTKQIEASKNLLPYFQSSIDRGGKCCVSESHFHFGMTFHEEARRRPVGVGRDSQSVALRRDFGEIMRDLRPKLY